MTAQPGDASDQRRNKAVVLRFIDEVQIGKDLSVVDDLFSAELVNHTASGDQDQSVQGMKDALKSFFSAFPDLDVEVVEQIAEGDLVSTLKMFKGTHQGTFRGIAPTGNPVEFRVMELVKVKNGKISDHWGIVESNTLMRQIEGSG